MISSDKSLTDCQRKPSFSEKASLWICTGSGPQMGFGHLRRSIILAQFLIDCCDPLFLIDPLDASSRDLLEQQGFSYCMQPLDQIWSILKKPNAILIDTRNPNGLEHLIKGAKDRGTPVTSIHDLGLNPIASDVVIDGSIAPELKVPDGSVFYSGLSYMVLDPEFCGLHHKQKPIREIIENIFINLGGGDSRKYYLKVLEGLKRWGRQLTVVGAPGYVPWGQESIEKMDLRRVDFRWEKGSIAPALFQADLAITAGGLSGYEALCVGTPLLALSYDEHQQKTIQGISNENACINLGPGDALDPELLSEKLAVLERDIEKRKQLSRRGRHMVDGLGFQRVSKIIRDRMPNCLCGF
jgi:spore coat polysaccharide biosynthesis predicted glycosyltransferase SpsG